MGVKYYLAVDIGASSGRHMLAHMEDGKICLEELYRFENAMDRRNGHKVWDTERLFQEIISGMIKCAEKGKIPYSMGVDTWGVDYVLLDQAGKQLGECYAYRDSRLNGTDDIVYKFISESDLYKRTGIQKAIFNTIYQLMADKEQEPKKLAAASKILMMPDYMHYLLCGDARQEYCNATTGQLINPKTNTWDMELIKMLGYPERIFPDLVLPGSVAGQLTKEVQQMVGFNCKVVRPATHDTASAVMSVPSDSDDCMYLSSGTWSLMGCELPNANCSKEAREANLTNEGGYDYRYRFLKNIMGLWMIQSVKKELEAGYPFPGKTGEEDLSFSGLCEMAEKEHIESIVDANDVCFLSPDSMIEAVQKACRDRGSQVPLTPGELARVIYRSLAHCYKRTIEEIERVTGKTFSSIHIVGGGSRADYLNRLTAKETGRTVYAGPIEASAIGNIGAQMIADGVFKDLKAFRRCVFRSFGVKTYEPV